MKQIILLLCLLFFAICNSQSTTKVVNKTQSANRLLNSAELKVAKEKYLQMMKTSTFIQIRKNSKLCARLLNKTRLFTREERNKIKDTKEFKRLVTKRITDNFEKTKFKNVEQGVNLIMETYELTERQFKENTELYILLNKASLDQIAEIMEPGHENIYDVINESPR